MKSIASAPRPSSGRDMLHLLAAPAESKGLPLPPLEVPVPVRCGADVAVEDGSRLRSGREGSAAGPEGAGEVDLVEDARPVNVDVAADPVAMPEGPTTIGTMICRVLPLLSVVVCVKVDRMILVSSGALLSTCDVVWSAFLLVVGLGAGVDCEDSASDSDAA
jgi:hypothetical protein